MALPGLLWTGATAVVSTVMAALPPGPGPFGEMVIPQPVPGAARAMVSDGWRSGKLCDISAPP